MSNSRFIRLVRFMLQHAGTIAAILFASWSVGEIFRDVTWVSGLLFYIPSPVVLVAMTAFAALKWKHASKQVRIISLLALTVVVVMVFGVENRFVARTAALNDTESKSTAPNIADSNNTLTIVHWNTCSGRLGQYRVIKKLIEQDADFYVLSEPPRRIKSWLQSSGRPATTFDKVLAVGGKGDTVEPQWLVKSPTSQICLIRWTRQGKLRTVFAVDLISDISAHREPILKELNELIEAHQPDLILGDFNAPRRSRQLQRLPTGYRHAYDVAGKELGYTWPVPLPVYALDQCIVGPSVEILSYDLQTSLSDHRLQRLEIQ